MGAAGSSWAARDCAWASTCSCWAWASYWWACAAAACAWCWALTCQPRRHLCTAALLLSWEQAVRTAEVWAPAAQAQVGRLGPHLGVHVRCRLLAQLLGGDRQPAVGHRMVLSLALEVVRLLLHLLWIHAVHWT